jgi:hypothetical protein
MATTIKIKNNATPSSTPSSLEQGEMALNVTDGRLFYGSGSGNDVKEFTGGGTTIDTGSFATTGSNTFIGDQIISGNLDVTGSATLTGITYPTADGDNGDIIFTDGAGVLSFGKNTVYASVKNITGGTLPKGMPVHASSSVGNTNEVIVASASNAATMPATFILAQQLDDEEEGLGIVTGYINGVNTSGFQEGDVIYVGENGGYINVKPSGSNLIQNLGIVTKVDATNGSGFIYGSGRANDTPNLLENHIFFGSSSNQQYQLHISGALDQTIINNITASGNISGSQTGSFAYLQLPGFEFNSSSASTELVVNGDISASGNIEATSFTGSYQGTFTQVTGLTITSQSWGLDGSIYSSSLSNANILANSLVEVIPSNTDYSIVLAAQLLPQNSGSSGQVTVFAVNEPTDDINVTINIFN